jgi:hypothetical protein
MMTHFRFDAYVAAAQAKTKEMGGTRPHFWFPFVLDQWERGVWVKAVEVTSEAEDNLMAVEGGYEPYSEERRLLNPKEHPERMGSFLDFVKENLSEYSSVCSHTERQKHKCEMCKRKEQRPVCTCGADGAGGTLSRLHQSACPVSWWLDEIEDAEDE